MIRAGAWQATGSAHAREGRAAQDAAIVRAAPFGAVAAVSDGCSSAPGSETAAWIWARSAAESFARGECGWEDSREGILEAIERRALRAGEALGLDLSLSLATLCLLLGNPKEEKARLLVWGDGFAGSMRAGAAGIGPVWSAISEANAPFYPGYRLCEGGTRRWLDLDNPGWEREGEAIRALEREEQSAGVERVWDFREGDLLFIATDGAASLPGIAPEAALGELGKIKGWAGEFLARRMSRAGKEWARAGASPQDDFAIAGLWREPGEAEEREGSHGGEA